MYGEFFAFQNGFYRLVYEHIYKMRFTVMKTRLAIILTAATLLGGCASIQDSYVNPMNWFGTSASN